MKANIRKTDFMFAISDEKFARFATLVLWFYTVAGLVTLLAMLFYKHIYPSPAVIAGVLMGVGYTRYKARKRNAKGTHASVPNRSAFISVVLLMTVALMYVWSHFLLNNTAYMPPTIGTTQEEK
jgi:hypothetical protein